MFDFVKVLFGLSSCRGCKYRRLLGLYCGCPHPRHGAWQRYGCWNYSSEPALKTLAASKEKTVRELLAKCEAYALDGLDFLNSISIEQMCAAYNGIGPAWFPEPLRKAVDKLDPVLRPIALPHDCRFTYGDGSREWFDNANDELEANGLKIADAEYRWYNPWRYVTRFRAHAYANACRIFGWDAYVIARHTESHTERKDKDNG